MKRFLIVLLAIISLLAACAPVDAVAPDKLPENERYYCTSPESDNGHSWSANARVCYDTQVYKLRVKVLGDLASNQTTNGSISGSSYNGFGSVSGRIWTEGKGVLPVQILSINPEAPWINADLPYVLKTTDLGVMGVPAGAEIYVICNHDVEVLSPVFGGQTLSTDRLTDELDDCRMATKNYTP